MYCMKCGNLLEQDAAFCGACGEAVVAVAVATPGPTPTAAPVAAPPVQVAPVPAVAVAAPLEYPYAGFWLRFVAYLIDGAVASVALGVVIVAMVLLVGVSYIQGLAAGFNNQNPAFPAALMLIFLAVLAPVFAMAWLYYASMESSSHQGTLGKMALGLIVTDTAGRRISFGRASGRFFAKMITGMVPLAIGYIMAGFTEKKQALHDMIASLSRPQENVGENRQARFAASARSP